MSYVSHESITKKKKDIRGQCVTTNGFVLFTSIKFRVQICLRLGCFVSKSHLQKQTWAALAVMWLWCPAGFILLF